MKNDVIVSIENLHVNLMTTRGVVCAVRGADLDIKKGEIHGLVGESGCGKTMTSKSILRLHDEKRMLYEGSIKLRDSQGNIKDILQLNITLNINKVTEDERVSTFMGGDGRNYDMIFCLWFSDFPDPAGNLNSVYPSTAGEEGGANAAVYNNSDVDTWLTEELASSDSTERTELMQKILDKVTDDVPYLVLDHPKVIMVTNSKVVEPKFSAEYQFNLFFKDFNLNK